MFSDHSLPGKVIRPSSHRREAPAVGGIRLGRADRTGERDAQTRLEINVHS